MTDISSYLDFHLRTVLGKGLDLVDIARDQSFLKAEGGLADGKIELVREYGCAPFNGKCLLASVCGRTYYLLTPVGAILVCNLDASQVSPRRNVQYKHTLLDIADRAKINLNLKMTPVIAGNEGLLARHSLFYLRHFGRPCQTLAGEVIGMKEEYRFSSENAATFNNLYLQTARSLASLFPQPFNDYQLDLIEDRLGEMLGDALLTKNHNVRPVAHVLRKAMANGWRLPRHD